KVPEAEDYSDLDDLILSVAALRQDKPPTQASFFDLDVQRLVDDWTGLQGGIEWAVEFLSEEHVYDAAGVPTAMVLPVLAALYGSMPPALDEHGNARSMLRKYMWRSFLTRRYTSSAATNAFQDFRALRDALTGSGKE